MSVRSERSLSSPARGAGTGSLRMSVAAKPVRRGSIGRRNLAARILAATPGAAWGVIAWFGQTTIAAWGIVALVCWRRQA